MTTKYRDFTVDIIDDSDYTPNSSDNLNKYDKVYFDDTGFQPTSKHGISVNKAGAKQASAIICGTGGATRIHENSFIIQGDSLFLCCCNKVYSLGLPELKLNWESPFDAVTCFGIRSFKGDFIIHGELEVKRIDINGNIKWNFSAKDIFVTQDGSDALILKENRIELTDWDGDKYLLDENGQLTK